MLLTYLRTDSFFLKVEVDGFECDDVNIVSATEFTARTPTQRRKYKVTNAGEDQGINKESEQSLFALSEWYWTTGNSILC